GRGRMGNEGEEGTASCCAARGTRQLGLQRRATGSGPHLARGSASGYRTPTSPHIANCSANRMPKITYIDHAGTARTVDGEIGSTVMETAIKKSIPGIEAG